MIISILVVQLCPIPSTYSVYAALLLLLLRCRMVDQNVLEAFRKSFSMASPNSSHTWVFALATAEDVWNLGLLEPVSCLQPKRPDRILLQLDEIPNCQYPLGGFWDYSHNRHQPPYGHSLRNGGMEYGPIGLDIPRLPETWLKVCWSWNWS